MSRSSTGDFAHVSGVNLPGRPAEFKVVAIDRARDGRIAHVRMLR
jgi:hypothetical protein